MEYNHSDRLVIAAYLYYEEGLTQEEISRRLNISRVSVTRLLQKARQDGIVQVTITRNLPEQFELEEKLIRAFELKRAVVVKTCGTREDTFIDLGKAGGALILESVSPNCHLGVAWSETVSYIANHIQTVDISFPITINELAGTHLSQSTQYGASWKMAERLKARLVSVPVPVVMKDAAAREAILHEESIRQAFEQAARVDLAVVGLGNVGDNCSLVRTGFLSLAQVETLRQHGAVGDILMRFFDKDGQHIPSPLEEQIISLDWEEIRQIPHIIAAAAGYEKVEVILAALRSRLIHSLVTDSDTARQVLAAV